MIKKDEKSKRQGLPLQESMYKRGVRILRERKMTKTNRRNWLKRERKYFNSLKIKPSGCYVCGFEYTEQHHIYPLTMQYDDGIREAYHQTISLCPNHHLMEHILIKDSYAIEPTKHIIKLWSLLDDMEEFRVEGMNNG